MNHGVPTKVDRQDGRPFLRRPRILLSAYSCGPNWGSEPGVGWRRATEIARYCDVWVLAYASPWQQRISDYLRQHGPIPNLEFVFIGRRPWESVIENVPNLSYIAYRAWLRRALHVARRLHAEVGFDLAHHITYSGFREPSYLYKLGIPFVWGPVGGAQNYPWRFLPGAGVAAAAIETARSVLNLIQLHTSPRVRAAARSASAIFAANPENQQKIRDVLGADSIPLCDVGTDAPTGELLRPRSNAKAIKILWVGRLITRKALEILIEALALLPVEIRYELTVIGDGPRRRSLQKLAQRRGVSPHIRWCGQVSQQEAHEQFLVADVFAFTSLRDTTGTVVLEALAAGTPVICLDHQGAGAVVTPECGIKIPVTNRREVERQLSETIIQLQRNRYHCRSLGQAPDGAPRNTSGRFKRDGSWKNTTESWIRSAAMLAAK